MTTKTALRKVASAITGLQNAVSNTFAEQAHNITEAARLAFGQANWEIPKPELNAVVDMVAEASPWAGTSSEAARRSEVTTVVKAYPFLDTACDVFKREFGELRREHLVKIARLCPQSETARDAGLLAVEFFTARKKPGKSATPAEKLASGMTQAINNAGDPALKQALYRLCRKYNISVK